MRFSSVATVVAGLTVVMCANGWPATESGEVAILSFADITVGSHASDVSPALLRELFETLKRDGFEFIALHEVEDAVAGLSPLPPKAIALSFNRASEAFAGNAVPLLEEFGAPVTLFFPTLPVGTYHPFDGRRFLAWGELSALGSNPLIRFGSMGVTGASFEGMATSTVDFELLQSRAIIEAQTSVTVQILAYPQGYHSAVVRDAASDAGYRAGYASEGGLQPWPSTTELMRLRRFPVVGATTVTSLRSALGQTELPPGAPLIIDNATTGGFVSSGFSVQTVVAGAGQYGPTYAVGLIGGPPAVPVVAEWRFAVHEPGDYDLYAWWPSADLTPFGMASGVSFTLESVSPIQVIGAVDQESSSAGRWVFVGRVGLLESSLHRVRISAQGATGTHLYADAIKLVYVAPSTVQDWLDSR